MPATIRLGTCSFADEGLVKTWYPRGVSTPKARLGYYAERFDTVEVDSPYYHLPDPAVTGRWAQRTPPEFVFHVKAHASMTGTRAGRADTAFARVPRVARAARALRKAPRSSPAVPPSVREVGRGKAELEPVRALLDPLVPLVEFRHRSWLEEDERADTFAFLERNGLAYVSVDAPRTRASNVVPPIAAATHPSRTSASTAATPRPGTSGPRNRGSASTGCTPPRSSRSGSTTSAGWPIEADEVYALFNNNRDDFAPRSAMILRGLLDEAGVPASGGIEPPPERRRSSDPTLAPAFGNHPMR